MQSSWEGVPKGLGKNNCCWCRDSDNRGAAGIVFVSAQETPMS